MKKLRDLEGVRQEKVGDVAGAELLSVKVIFSELSPFLCEGEVEFLDPLLKKTVRERRGTLLLDGEVVPLDEVLLNDGFQNVGVDVPGTGLEPA